MGKKLLHAAHFTHSLKRHSKNRFKRIAKFIEDDVARVRPQGRPNDKKLYKYWKNRKALFSRVDSGSIYMTDELWFSVTPENIARFVAEFCRACVPEVRTVLDVFCGGGGNSIQFAMQFPRVIGVDNSLEHLYCTAQNAKVYDVADRIWLRYGSWVKFAKEGSQSPKLEFWQKLDIGVVFASPPWGGPEYLRETSYDVERHLKPLPLSKLLESFFKISKNVILFLPRNCNLYQLARITRRLLGPMAKCRVLYVKDNGYLKGILCMWGEPFVHYTSSQVGDDGSQETSSNERSESVDDEGKTKSRKLDDSLYDISG